MFSKGGFFALLMMALFIAAGCSSLSKQANLPKYSETNDSASALMNKGVNQEAGSATSTKGERKKRNVKY